MDSKIKVLAIAPYNGMRSMLINIAKEFEEIDMTVIVGDLEAGVDQTVSTLQHNYDILLSRGGTAKLLRETLSLPVVEISVSGYDILRTLKLANAHNGRSAVVGFPNVAHEIAILQELLHYQIDIYPINSTEQAVSTLYSLMDRHYTSLLCDMVTHTTASRMGMNAFLITSGAESIREAIRTAIFIYRANQQLQSENQFFRQLLQGMNRQTVVFSEDGKLVYATSEADNLELLNTFKSRCSTLPADGRSKIILQVQGLVYNIITQKLHLPEQDYVAFHFTASNASYTRERSGIKVYNREQVEKTYLQGPYNIVEFTSTIHGLLQHAAAQNRPALLVGEPGTGKAYAAYTIYLNSEKSAHPFVEIDCSALDSKSWQYLINHHNSPMYDVGSTFFFRTVDALSREQLLSLLGMLSTDRTSWQNKIILSINHSPSTPSETAELILSRIECQSISLSPLRNHPQLISRLVHLYLNQFIADHQCPFSDIKADALQLLCQYSWPQNYPQFRRVLERIAAMTNSPRITADVVNEALQQELLMLNIPTQSTGNPSLDISLTLHEIESSVAHLVLEANKGNHTKTAESLGISRSTLWRMLKE